MKGIIFNLVEDVVVESHGVEAWDALLESAGVDGSWTALGNYPDAQLGRLVTSGAAMLGLTPQELTRVLGRQVVGGLAQRYPQFFAPHATTRPFLLTLDEVIHAEVCKLYPDARPPRFDFRTDDADVLEMTYTSERGLCSLAEGMIEGSAAHFGEVATVVQTACTADGAPGCVLRCSFAPAP